MRKRGIIYFIASIVSLVVGASCHVLRTSDSKVLFVIGAVIGIAMLASALVFGILGFLEIVKSKKGR
ncbi:MAG: hypothetical protein MJ057_00380 [Sphaerochaetaceae bacterium]|nr:hypothetical protein [Sphaerochaetaceae bacterium]